MPASVLHFYLADLGFHVVLVATIALLAWRWRRRLTRKRLPVSLWLLHLAADAMILSWVIPLAALFAGVFAPERLFTSARFMGQGLFAEGSLYAVYLTWLFATVSGAMGHLRKGALLPGCCALLLLLVYWEGYWHGPSNLQVRQYQLDLSHGHPVGRLRIVHLSDVQSEQFGRFQERALQRAKSLNGDLIAFTGDYAQQGIWPDKQQAREEFNALLRKVDFHSRLGAFAVQGDCEADREWPSMFQGTGIRCLHNDCATVSLPGGRTLAVVGLSVRAGYDDNPAPMEAALARAPRGALRIMLSHRADFVQHLAGKGAVDLVLAGHTHGGQVVIPFYGPPVTLSSLPRRFAGGFHYYDDIPLLVSRGIGMERATAPQVRLFCPPEICVLDLTY